MKFRIAYITIFILFCITGMEARQKPGSPLRESIDRDLDDYERICGECAVLRSRVRAGDAVSKGVAENTIELFVSKHRELKVYSHDMTACQRARFAAVGQWFASGERPLLLSATPLPDVASSCRLVRGYAEPESDEPDSIPFVPAFGSRPSRSSLMKSAGLKTWILVNGAFPYPAAGLSFFMRKGIWGGYASFRSDFRFMKPVYHCTSDGFLPDGSVMWPGERKLRTALSFTAGPVAGINKWLSLYAGAGYGYSHCMWTDIDGCWVQVDDLSVSGLAVEAGCLFTFGHFSFSAGVASSAFRTVSAVVGAGICF